jgi:hypothetical protein
LLVQQRRYNLANQDFMHSLKIEIPRDRDGDHPDLSDIHPSAGDIGSTPIGQPESRTYISNTMPEEAITLLEDKFNLPVGYFGGANLTDSRSAVYRFYT